MDELDALSARLDALEGLLWGSAGRVQQQDGTVAASGGTVLQRVGALHAQLSALVGATPGERECVINQYLKLYEDELKPILSAGGDIYSLPDLNAKAAVVMASGDAVLKQARLLDAVSQHATVLDSEPLARAAALSGELAPLQARLPDLQAGAGAATARATALLQQYGAAVERVNAQLLAVDAALRALETR